MNRYWVTMDKIYYISQGNTRQEHLNNIQNVCEAGCKLVQLRLKDVSDQEYVETAFKAKEICIQHGTILIINDKVAIAKEVNADGVHLGKNDLSPSAARTVLGNKIIGGTANSLEDCLELINQKIDYIGLGPFRFTDTKKNLSPVLGLEGIQNIISEIRKKGHDLPIYTIGGIKESDFEALSNTGVSGIAISGLLTGKNKEELSGIIDRCESIFNKEILQ